VFSLHSDNEDFSLLYFTLSHLFSSTINDCSILLIHDASFSLVLCVAQENYKK